MYILEDFTYFLKLHIIMYILIDFFKKVVFKDANKMAFTNVFILRNITIN